MALGLGTRAELLARLLALGHRLVGHIDQRLGDLGLQPQLEAQLHVLLDFVQARFDRIEELILGQCGMWTLLRKVKGKVKLWAQTKSSLVPQISSKVRPN